MLPGLRICVKCHSVWNFKYERQAVKKIMLFIRYGLKLCCHIIESCVIGALTCEIIVHLYSVVILTKAQQCYCRWTFIRFDDPPRKVGSHGFRRWLSYIFVYSPFWYHFDTVHSSMCCKHLCATDKDMDPYTIYYKK